MSRVLFLKNTYVFRTAISVILIFVLAGIFLFKMDDVSRRVEETAVKQMLVDINTSLALVVYQTAVKRNFDRLDFLANQNPFHYLALTQDLPKDYHGEVESLSEIKRQGWYYLRDDKQVIYRNSFDENNYFFLDFSYADLNDSGRYEFEQDSIIHLVIKKAPE